MKLPPSVARYELLARDLRRRILDGEWGPGATITGAPSLAREYDVTQSIAQKALEQLVIWQIARTGAGRGTVVLPLREYLVTVRPAAWDSADEGVVEAIISAVESDPMISGATVQDDAVSAMILAAHPGHAADWLMQILRAMSGIPWDLAAATVSAAPA